MKTKKDYAKMIDSAIKLVNVKEIRIRTIEKGLEAYARNHTIDFVTDLGLDKTVAEIKYAKWITNKEQ